MHEIGCALTVPLALLAVVGACTFWVSRSFLADSAHDRDESVVFAQLALKTHKHFVQIQQCHTDLSTTRTLDGLDDGFAEAEESYQSFLAGGRSL